MNQQKVEELLSVIKTSSDKNVIIHGLTKLRTYVVKDKDGIVLFRRAGGVAPMVRFLNKPYEKILEVVLSILGNCCTDDDSCREALELKVITSLTTILKAVSNPLIQNRACRLLGNLAKFNASEVLATHCPAIAQAIYHIIEDTVDVQNRIMAFRACRLLSSCTQFVKKFFETNGLQSMLSAVISLIKNNTENITIEESKETADLSLTSENRQGLKHNLHRETYFEEVVRNLEGVQNDFFDHEMSVEKTPDIFYQYKLPTEESKQELLWEILKCLLVTSEFEISLSILESLNKENYTLRPIVYLTRAGGKYRSVALKILSNIAKLPGAFYILSSSDAIFATCNLLTCKKESSLQLNSNEIRHCINIISMLSTDACNRSKIRRSGTLKKLLHLLRDTNSFTEKNSILYVFINFQYDSMSMDLLLQEGLVGILINELKEFNSSDQEFYKKKREERLSSSNKRKAAKLAKDSRCKFPKIRDHRTIIDYESLSSSPMAFASPYSPCSSRSLSPVMERSCTKEVSDEESYSPVYSDEDDDDDKIEESHQNVNDARAGDNEHLNQNALDVGLQAECTEDNILLGRDDDDEVSKDTSITKLLRFGNLPHDAIDIIDSLLFRITCLMKKCSDLGKSETIKTLINAVSLFGQHSDFTSSLANILLESQFFSQVVRYGVAYDLFQLTKIQEIRKEGLSLLNSLSSVGECNYGKEELNRSLRCKNTTIQKKSAITIAFVVNNKQLLYSFLNDGNALSILLDTILSEKHDEFSIQAIDALTCMSRYSLAIRVPSIDRESEIKAYEVYSDKDIEKPLHENCDVRFIVYCGALSAASGDSNDNHSKSVGFNKALLCTASDVFNKMLNSDFREGNEGEIHLHNYSLAGLRYFLSQIVRKSLHQKPQVPNVEQYEILLEAFEMSRVYIVPDMEKDIFELIKYRLNASNCLKLFEWSMRNYHQELSEIVMKYYLCCDLNSKEKLSLFYTAECSAYFTEWYDMIVNTIMDKCRSITFA